MINSLRLLLLSLLYFLFPTSSYSQTMSVTDGKILISEVTVDVPIDKAWWAWTTDRGVRSFLAVDSKIDFRVGGNYNISLYTKDNFPDTNNRILSFIPFRMITFEMEIPNKFSTIEREKTQVVVEFTSRSSSQTDVKLTQLGWGKQGEWLAAYDYFQQTWLLALTDMQTYLPDFNKYEKKKNEEVRAAKVSEKKPKTDILPPASKTISPPSKYSFNSTKESDIDGINLSNTPKKETPTPTKPISEETTSKELKSTDMQQFAYKLSLVDPELARNPKAWTPKQNTIVGTHFNYLKKLTEKGIVIMAGRSLDPEIGFGIVIFEASSREVAQEIMNSDPAVKNGLMAAEFHDFRIALMRE